MATRQFFQVIDQVAKHDRWFLGAPKTEAGQRIDPESFTYGTSLEIPEPLIVEVRQGGNPVDFTFGDFDMPVLSEKCVAILKAIAPQAIQVFKSSVEGYDGDFAIANFLQVVYCLDERASDVRRWKEGDGRPEKTGQLRQVTKLRLDSSKIKETDKFFRVGGWDVALIVSNEVKSRLEEGAISGIRYIQV